MTIRFSPHSPGASPPEQSPTGTPNQPGSGHARIRHAHAGAVTTLDLDGWLDIHPDGSPQGSSHLHDLPKGHIPIPPPPAGETDPMTRNLLGDRFHSLLNGGNDGNGGNDANQNDNGGNDSGNVNPPPLRHLTIDDLLQLLTTESAEGFKMAAKQTQLATTEKMEALTDMASDILGAGKDRRLGSILAGVGTMGQGVAQMGGAGVSLRGISAATTQIDTAGAQAANANAAAAANNGAAGVEAGADAAAVAPAAVNNGTLDAISRAQIFNNLTAAPQSVAQGIGGVASTFQGGMSVGQAAQESDAVTEDADKTSAEKAAAADDALHDNAQNQKQQYLQVMQDYNDKKKNLEQSTDQTAKTIARSV